MLLYKERVVSYCPRFGFVWEVVLTCKEQRKLLGFCTCMALEVSKSGRAVGEIWQDWLNICEITLEHSRYNIGGGVYMVMKMVS